MTKTQRAKQRLRFRALCLIALATALTVSACDQKRPGQTDTPLAVLVMASPEIKDIVQAELSDWLSSKPRTNAGQIVNATVEAVPAALALKQISRGQQKPHLWITPAQLLSETLNQKVVNLGTPQKDCIPLFSSTVMAAYQKDSRRRLGLEGDLATLSKLLPEEKPEKSRYMAHLNPLMSDIGLVTLINLASISANADTEQAVNDMRARQMYVGRYADSTAPMLTMLAKSAAGTPRFTLTTEQALRRFNFESPEIAGEVGASYISDAAVELRYELCRAEVDWYTEAEREAQRMVKEELLRLPLQERASEAGYTPLRFIKQVESDATPPKLRAENSVSAEALGRMLETWPSVVRPRLLFMLIDGSASMADGRLAKANEIAIAAVDKLKPGELYALSTFTTETTNLITPTGDRSKLPSALFTIEPLGGTAIFDALVQTLQTLAKPELENYQKQILVFSDGEEQNSDASSDKVLSRLSLALDREDITISVVAFDSPNVSYRALEQFSAVTGGVFTKIGAKRNVTEVMTLLPY